MIPYKSPALVMQLWYSLTESAMVIRYLAEFKTGTERKDAAENTMVAYKAAQVNIFSLLLLVSKSVGYIHVVLY
jgi:hypothetical protein